MEIFRRSMSRLFIGKGKRIFHSIIMIVQALCYLSVFQIVSITSESDVKLLFTRHPHQIVLHSLERNSSEVIVNVTGTPQSLAFDLENKKIYWAIRSGESYEATGIQRANMINGLQMETVLFKSEGLNVFTGIALDWITLNIYYVDGRQMQIGVCDNDGVNCAILVHDAENQPFRIAVCPNEGFMFWTVRGGWPRAIFRAEMDGSHVTAIVKDGVNLPGAIAVDSTRIYWSDPDVGKIGTSDMNGNDVRFWEPEGPSSFGSIMHVTVSTDKIFWVNTNDQTIKTCDKNNCSKISIVEKLTKLHILHDMIPISRDAQPRYRDNPCAAQPCPHICALTAKSFRCFCPIGLTLGDDGVTCTDQGAKMVITTPNEIQVLSLGTTKTTHIAPIHHPTGVTYDFAHKRVYWADFNNGVYRANITGEAVEQVFRIPGRSRVTGMAYDWITGNIYYTNGDHVGVCDNLGKACAVLLRERPDPPYRIALFPKLGMMYWTTRGTLPSIKRARMDGSSPFRIIRGTAMRGSLVIDQREHRMFWLDRSDSIETSDLEWRDRRTIRPLRNQLAGVGVEGGRLYWIDAQMVQSCDKKTLMDLKTVTVNQDNLNVLDMVLFHAEGQPDDRHNHCKGHICSHVCVLTEHYLRCLCPEGMTLGPDGRTCQDCSASDCNVQDAEPLCKPKVNERMRSSNKTCLDFACTSGSCLDAAKVCDGVCDCDDGTDEGLGCNESCDQLDCSQSCKILPGGPQCTCSLGFRLATDSKTCEDVNECEIPGICSSACINLNGSYSCGNYSTEDAFVRKSLVAVAAILTVFAVGVVAIAAVVGYKYKQAREIIRSLTPEEIEEFLQGNESAAKRASDGPEKAFLLPFKHVLPPDSINIAYEAILGSGNFAVVYRGFYGPEAVAVKKFKRTVEVNAFKSVLAEAKIMAYIGEHEHIVRFIGADVSKIAEQKIVLVTELSSYGDLLSFLRNIQPMVLNQHNPTDSTVMALAPSQKTYVPIGVTPTTLLSWCGQIASALGFLELKKIVHGDLAARNVLIFKDYVVKIADFGLSKQLYDTSEYISNSSKFLPWRWAAPEVLSRLEFSSESDIWSFGVTAWEILSLGREPYEDFFAYGSAFRAHLQDGHRLECPEWADQLVYQMLLNCWNIDRCNRPRFPALSQFFSQLDAGGNDCSSEIEEPAPPYSQVFPSDTISG